MSRSHSNNSASSDQPLIAVEERDVAAVEGATGGLRGIRGGGGGGGGGGRPNTSPNTTLSGRGIAGRTRRDTNSSDYTTGTRSFSLSNVIQGTTPRHERGSASVDSLIINAAQDLNSSAEESAGPYIHFSDYHSDATAFSPRQALPLVHSVGEKSHRERLNAWELCCARRSYDDATTSKAGLALVFALYFAYSAVLGYLVLILVNVISAGQIETFSGKLLLLVGFAEAFAFMLVLLPFCGRVGDTCLNRYRTVQCGLWLVYIGMASMCLVFVIYVLSVVMSDSVKLPRVVDVSNSKWLLLATLPLMFVGLACFQGNVVQLARDQLHEPSPTSVSRFVHAFVWTGIAGKEV